MRLMMLIPIATLLMMTMPLVAQQAAIRRPAVPLNPIAAIVDAFRSHALVAFSDAHGNRELSAFTLDVVRDGRIGAVVNDLVIENGNASYQDVMDRYVRGEDVSYDMLRAVWENTTQVQTLGPRAGAIPELYRVVRALNATRPANRQLRVLLGDPPINWNAIRAEGDLRKWIEMRDSHAAGMIQREVLAKGRRALVMYGQGHLQRKNLLANYESAGLAGTVLSILEETTGTRVFSIWWLTGRLPPPAEAASWPVPSLALVRGTTLGALDFTEFEAAPPARAEIRDGKIVPVPRERWRSLRMEDQFDAVLNLGKSSGAFVPGQSDPTPAHCADPAWLAEWTRRLDLGPQASRKEAARLRQYCART
jgi:hypothetical protein